MPDASTLAIVAVASLALAIVPGPAVLYIVTRSMSQGRAAGIASVGGIHIGTMVHITAAALGLSALLARSALAFDLVKYAGAAYLVYLGIRNLRDRTELDRPATPADWSLRRVLAQGVVVNVLNPKTALFFLAFLPQFVDPQGGAAPLQMLFLGLVFMVVALVSDSMYAVVTSGLVGRLQVKTLFTRHQRVFSGGVFMALGITAALSGSRPTN